LLFLDAASGIAGDMFIAALLDLGVPLEAVESAARCLPLEGYRLVAAPAFAGAIGGYKFDVVVERAQPERTYREIDAMLVSSPLEPRTRDTARRIFRRLAEAESEVHRVSLDEVHFHEVGAVDAIVDIVGAAAALTYVGAAVAASPLPLGRGTVNCRHGVLPLPAPAALLCLRGVPTYDAGIEAELVTPTGAAIVATVAERYARWPSISPEHVGWGCGSQRLPDRVNALRAVLGTEVSADGHSGVATHVVLEANIDDITGELAAHAIEVLLAAGARDAWATPITMKKGRPALTLGALAEVSTADAIAHVMLRETTTIGVRRTFASRVERPRRTVDIATEFGPIPVKISEGPYGAPQLKPEFDACARAASAHGVSAREVLTAALVASATIPRGDAG
jgi:hypothetical protein